MNKILGKEYVDTVTLFRGVAVAVTYWLNGCTRVTLQPTVDEKGAMRQSETFDSPQLKEIGPSYANDSTPRGGPRDDAAALRR